MRTRTAAGLLALTLLALPFAAACGEATSVEVSRRDPDDTRSPRADDPPETDPPETDPPETDPPDTDPPATTTRPTLSVPPPPTPAPSGPTPTDPPVTEPPPTAAPTPDRTTDPNPTGSLPPVDDLIALIPVSPPGDIDFDKSTDGCGIEGLCILTLVVNNTDYNAVAGYYEAEFPTLGVSLDAVANDGTMWSATMNAPGVTGFVFVEASVDWPGYTDVLLSFFPA